MQMMISDPNLIYYACVARGTTVLAEFNSKHEDLGALALKCLEKAPPLHSIFSHTVRNRSYTFFIHGSFVYFAIFDEKLENPEGLAFLKSVKDAFTGAVDTGSAKKRLEHLSPHCFQGEFNPVFHQLLASGHMEGITSPRPDIKVGHVRDMSSDSLAVGGSWPVGRPLLANGANNLMKKKKRNLLDECLGGAGRNDKDEKSWRGLNGSESDDGSSTEFTVVMNKNGLYAPELGHQKAKKVWRKHVWVVLSMDLIICTILFVLWLCICRGFKCVDS